MKSLLIKICCIVGWLATAQFTSGQQNTKPVFKVIPLGVYGGSDESNLSSYMLSTADSDNYICLDAGTLHTGITKAIEQKNLVGTVGNVLKTNIKGYLISHPHLDHLAGMIINSPDDIAKNIYALPFCITTISEKYFSWKSWANFADAGEAPQLKKYHYVTLGDSETTLQNTSLSVKAFELSHSNPFKSTAFLVRHDSSFVLYLGDTGADSIEKSMKLAELWQYVAPLVKRRQLKGIFIEVSFPNEQPKDKLFGHLSPELLMDEMGRLSALCGNNHLQQVPIIITHIKPTVNNEMLIKEELKQENKLQLKLIFPKQGERIDL